VAQSVLPRRRRQAAEAHKPTKKRENRLKTQQFEENQPKT
jgi:hypothetical protein